MDQPCRRGRGGTTPEFLLYVSFPVISLLGCLVLISQVSPTPSGHQHLSAPGASVSTNKTSRSRPIINTNLSHDSLVSTSPTTVMNRLPQSAPPDGSPFNGVGNGNGHGNGHGTSEVDLSMLNPGERAMAWHNQGKATAMLRTSSDGADVTMEERGIEWEVIEGHGTGKGQRQHHRFRSKKMVKGCNGLGAGASGVGRMERRHSLEPPETYTHFRRALPWVPLSLSLFGTGMKEENPY